MKMNQYDILTKDGRHVVVFAESHTVEGGALTLHRTHQGMESDIFPAGYWTRYAVNGVEQSTEEINE